MQLLAQKEFAQHFTNKLSVASSITETQNKIRMNDKSYQTFTDEELKLDAQMMQFAIQYVDYGTQQITNSQIRYLVRWEPLFITSTQQQQFKDEFNTMVSHFINDIQKIDYVSNGIFITWNTTFERAENLPRHQ